MSEFQIEKGIALPEKRKFAMKYPFMQLEVGDSFLVPTSDMSQDKRRGLQSNLCARAGQSKPARFSTRVVDGGIRVWRIA